MAAGRVAIVGAGPAGLMAAEAALAAGVGVVIFEAMPTAGRKLLMAGKSGLNITHSEPLDRFIDRFGGSKARLYPALEAFAPEAVRHWCAGLGVETFVGSSGRVFPTAMKASPLLRAWLARLDRAGAEFRIRHRWMGLEGKALVLDTPQGSAVEEFDAVVLTLGGASWPKLGSDGAWLSCLAEQGVPITPFRPANCGFEVNWSPIFAERFAGHPVKPVTATSEAGGIAGEFVVTNWGVEGSLIYAHAAVLRDALERDGRAELTLDLAPGRDMERLQRDIARQKAKVSFANRLRKGAGIDGVKLGLLREVTPDAIAMDAETLARSLKGLKLPLRRARPIERAISSAGGVAWEGVDDDFMLGALPGVFVAGEMIDWEAPTGGYLLTACLATGRAAGSAAARFAGSF
ncbi:MAG: NAD(FAD)-utilizing dehydrogenase [Pelagibacterium sp. SCN 63-23]|nr:MAG: NAD(FAD)-utilizing dehydrogenase [Pelagibacterium sp. SCN 63-23]